MYFQKARLKNFRNFLDLSIDISPNLNIFIGDNAQGKTNLLEALNLIIKGSSYRTNEDKEVINWDNENSYLFGEIIKDGESIQIAIALEKKAEDFYNNKLSKTIKINQKIQKKSALNKNFKGVVFSPEHLQIIKGAPALRRKFLNEQISQIYPLYYRYLSEYYRILGHRNNILKKKINQKKKREHLIMWDPRLIEKGSFLILTRIKFIKKINLLANKFHQEITKEKESIELTYQSNISKDQEENISSIRKAFMDKLEEYKEKEIEFNTTLFGPHRDDFSVYINKFNVASYGSQGQQRTAVLSLKLSELELIKEKEGIYPIFFLDDVMSELDEDRRHFLLELIIDKKVQTFITSINLDYFNSNIMEKSRIFKIKEGKVINL
ncbi:MAG: DNA replication/repair protein RecF [Candidatus Atribacteria bacterium]|nr:DNA replication/repair protein RecF [Candidatus Atribacteria bacterium]